MGTKEDKLKGKNILIVEDDPVSSEFLKEVLDDYGINLHFVKKGEDAVEYCRNNGNINLILMDIRLPGQNGYKTTTEIKSFCKDLPIIAQTAYALEGDREKALKAGCDDYISKPIRAALLLDLISRYL